MLVGLQSECRHMGSVHRSEAKPKVSGRPGGGAPSHGVASSIRSLLRLNGGRVEEKVIV